MTESDFARAVVQRLALMRRRALRVSDGTDARHGVYGLRALTLPQINSTGADYLVLPKSGGIRTVLARSWKDVEMALQDETAMFLEIKDPFARKRSDQLEQAEWLKFVSAP